MAKDNIRTDSVRASQIRVGIVAVIGLGLLLMAVIEVGKLFDVFADRYEIVTLVESAAGLMEGSPVTLAGQRIGQVSEIEFVPIQQRRADSNVMMRLSVNRSVQEQIRTNSAATIRSQGLLGDKLVDLEPGTTDAPVLQPGDTLRYASSMDMDDLMAAAAESIDSLRLMVTDLQVVTRQIVRGEGSLGKLVYDDALYDQLASATGQMASLLQAVNSREGAIGRMLHDPTLYIQLNRSVSRMDSLTTRVLAGEGTMGRLFTDDGLYQDLAGMAGRTDTTMIQLQELVTALNDEEGSFRRMLADPTLYDEFLRTVVELQAVIQIIRQDPSTLRPEVFVDIF